jgi:hypothetical protein
MKYFLLANLYFKYRNWVQCSLALVRCTLEEYCMLEVVRNSNLHSYLIRYLLAVI